MDLAAHRPLLPDPGVSRRGFLGGALAAIGVGSVLPTWLAEAAGAATPVAPTDGVLVVVTLAGGNDGLNTLVPHTGALRSRYEELRTRIAIPAADVLPVDAELGLHPSLPKLAARYAQGKVAIVQGVGQPTALDLSHFSSIATVMAGTATAARTTGWLGRFLDGTTEWDSGLRGLAVGASVPLHLQGTRARVTSVFPQGKIWGADTSIRYERTAHEALRAMGATSTGLGLWADRVATASRDALDMAQVVSPTLTPVPAVGLAGDLTLAARLLNAGWGTRVVSVGLSGWDTHATQLRPHAERLGQLDAGIDAFFRELRPELAGQAAVLVLSEFGRRAAANGSLGTDHGSAGLALLVGDRVRGGLHATHPSLTALDASGSLVPSVDFRSVYASVLERWLAADPAQLLGATYTPLDLFTSSPGS